MPPTATAVRVIASQPIPASSPVAMSQNNHLPLTSPATSPNTDESAVTMDNKSPPTTSTIGPTPVIPTAIQIPASRPTKIASNLLQQTLDGAAPNANPSPNPALASGSLHWRRYDLKVKVGPNTKTADKERMTKYTIWFTK